IVSKARLDLPEPDSPVITISASRGSSTETSLRLCSRAPVMTILSETGTNNESTQANRCSLWVPPNCGKVRCSEGGRELAPVLAGGRIGGVEAGEDADDRLADQVAALARVEVSPG